MRRAIDATLGMPSVAVQTVLTPEDLEEGEAVVKWLAPRLDDAATEELLKSPRFHDDASLCLSDVLLVLLELGVSSISESQVKLPWESLRIPPIERALSVTPHRVAVHNWQKPREVHVESLYSKWEDIRLYDVVRLCEETFVITGHACFIDCDMGGQSEMHTLSVYLLLKLTIMFRTMRHMIIHVNEGHWDFIDHTTECHRIQGSPDPIHKHPD